MITEQINPITEQNKTFMCCFTFSVVFHSFFSIFLLRALALKAPLKPPPSPGEAEVGGGFNGAFNALASCCLSALASWCLSALAGRLAAVKEQKRVRKNNDKTTPLKPLRSALPPP